MKRTIVSLALLVAGATPLSAEAEKFDIASFTVPNGWQRIDGNGMVRLRAPMGTGGPSHYCQIYIFASRPSPDNAAANFAADWSRLIAKPLGATAQPTVTSDQTPDGWTVVSGTLNVVQRGIPVTMFLSTV